MSVFPQSQATTTSAHLLHHHQQHHLIAPNHPPYTSLEPSALILNSQHTAMPQRITSSTSSAISGSMARSVPVGNGFGPNGAAAEAEPPSGAFPPIGSLGASIAAYQPNFFDRGAFGTVFQARLINQDNRRVAVKTVLQDKRYRNRELPLMKSLTHPNIVTLFYYYFSTRSADPRGDKCLNLVMEFMPSNVSHLIPRKPKQRDPNSIPNTPLAVKVVMYQIFRALSYIHLNGICHRDIKPNNLLFNHADGVLKVCDFGSAKRLVPGERNVSYICARYYRAPELLFGATNYTNMIDLWSAGIVFSELLLGFPIFYESSGIDQLVNIISKLGTPKTEEIQAMNKDYVKFNLPEVPRIPLRNLFANNVASISEVTLDLIGQLFQYDPQKRIRPLDACAHPYFDELRDPSKKWVNGRELPRLFNFTEEELSGASEELVRKLIPVATVVSSAGRTG
ncbi:hypothetical protein TYRP_011975 [Tyrophagus putrescentiae]|nr:hypothetical protein TYRP_011975 [Tyrophagus putrescentiae]